MTSQKLLPLKVHRHQIIRDAQNFRSHKKGIPEWLKNADDSYNRLEESGVDDFKNTPIILGLGNKYVFCLDFGSSDGEKVIKYLPYYGDPDAATQGQKMINKSVSGGHGNGGKYYGLSAFKDCKILNYHNGKLTIMTLNNEGEFVDIENKKLPIFKALKIIGLDKLDFFKNEGKILLEDLQKNKKNLFCWLGVSPLDGMPKNKNSLNALIRSFANSPQSLSALRDRKVHVLNNGKLYFKDLKPEKVDIDENFGTREFQLPDKLGNYKFNKNKKSILKISFSKEPLTGEKSSLNILQISAKDKNIAQYNIPTLVLEKSISKYLTAQIDCPELREYNCVTNDRVFLAENIITNEFLLWCKSKIQEVLEELVNKEKNEKEIKNLKEIGNFLQDILNNISDLLEDDILQNIYDKEGDKITKVDVISENPGFGKDGKIKHKGDGKRKGAIEEREETSTEKKAKALIKVLVSGVDDDPINPGNKYHMIERHPVLDQRTEDVNHGIWWINSQKKYIKELDIKNPSSRPFFSCLVKEVVLSMQARRKYKQGDRFDPAGLEELNFELIDKIFSKLIDNQSIFKTDKTTFEKILAFIKDKKEFTISEISKELDLDPVLIHVNLKNNEKFIESNFKIKKEQINGKGGEVNVYSRK